MAEKYKLLVDDGKPYEEMVEGLGNLKKKLTELKNRAENEEFASLDLFVYDEKGKDITDEILKKLGLN